MEIRVKRLVAALIDHVIGCAFSIMIIAIVTLGKLEITAFSLVLSFVSYIAYVLLRDLIFKNASIGKRILKLQIVKKDGTKLTLMDIIKRNLTAIFLLPLEVLLILLNGE